MWLSQGSSLTQQERVHIGRNDAAILQTGRQQAIQRTGPATDIQHGIVWADRHGVPQRVDQRSVAAAGGAILQRRDATEVTTAQDDDGKPRG